MKTLKLIACFTLVGCGVENGPDSPAVGASVVASPPVATQDVPDPCAWIPPQDVEEILGRFAAAPRLAWSANTPEADPHGAACLYSIATERGNLAIVLEVDLTGGLDDERGIGMGSAHATSVAREQEFDDELGGLFDEFLRDLTSAPGSDTTDSSEWDYTGGLPGFGIWRIGHFAVKIGGDTLLLEGDRLARLASRVRQSVSDDKPFRAPRSGPYGHLDFGSGGRRNPCDLLTRAEAESVLGPLVVEPYRSVEETALAAASGDSCSYLGANHRVLVLTPEYSDGRMLFGMVAGFGGNVRSLVGGADAGDLLDGPWEQATEGGGVLFFQDRDRLLKVVYLSSSTDVDGAGKLASLAVPRLSAPK